MNGQEYARGLRLIADWYEAHPDMPIPYTGEICVFGVKETREEAARIAEALKPCRKEWAESFLKITRDFGGVTLKFVFNREAVCTRRVVRHKEIPAEFSPARVVEIVTWDCEPILQGAEEEATSASLS